MVKINGHTIKQLSEWYKIPKTTIYNWNKENPNTVFHKIAKRRSRDLSRVSRLAKQNLIEKSVKQAEKIYIKREEPNKGFKFDALFVALIVSGVILSMYLYW